MLLPRHKWRGYYKILHMLYSMPRYFDEIRANFILEDLTPEEERKRELEMELRHIQKKYDDDWMKYYPYHLDPDYDDENGNPYDYGSSSGTAHILRHRRNAGMCGSLCRNKKHP